MGVRRNGVGRENKRLVKRTSFEVFTEGNLDVIDEVIRDDYVLHDPTTPEEIRGQKAYKEYVQTYRDAFSDIDITTDAIIAEGDTVAVRFTIRGTHTDPFPEAPDLEPTNRDSEVIGMEFDRIQTGQLAETWQVYDVFGLLHQLGVAPS